MPDLDPMTAVLEQLQAARGELDDRIAEDARRLFALEDDRDRIDAAIAVLKSTEAPASGDRPVRREAGLPRPESQAGAGVSVDTGVERTIDPPSVSAGSSDGGQPSRVDGALSTGKRVPHKASGVTPEQVLEHVGEDWTAAGPIAQAVGLSRVRLRVRLAALLEDGRIEKTGERAGTRYRRVDVERAVDQPGLQPHGKDDQPPAARPVDGSLNADTPAAESEPAPPASSPESLIVDRQLVDRIEGMLHRARSPLSVRDIAKSLVVNIADVSQQLHIMVKQTETGRFPGVYRDPSGGYSLLVEAAA